MLFTIVANVISAVAVVVIPLIGVYIVAREVWKHWKGRQEEKPGYTAYRRYRGLRSNRHTPLRKAGHLRRRLK